MKKTVFTLVSMFLLIATLLSISTFATDLQKTPTELIHAKIEEKTRAIESVFGSSVEGDLKIARDGKSAYIYSAEKENKDDGIEFLFENDKIVGAKLIKEDVLSKGAVCNSTEVAKSICENNIQNIKTILDFTKEYRITSWDEIDDFIVIYHAIYQLENGLKNEGQSINIVYDKSINKIVQIRGFDYDVNTKQARISQEEAIDIAFEYVGEETAVNSCALKYIDPTLYRVDSGETTTYYLAYKINLSNGFILMIDAKNGNVIGVDMVMGDEARCYTIAETHIDGQWGYRVSNEAIVNDINVTRDQDIGRAKSAFQRLGYNVTLSQQFSTRAINDSVQYYLEGNNSEYGFYFKGHGAPDQSMMGTIDVNDPVFTRSDVHGNWHFVYLDGCWTAENDDWADAFKIDGYSNRAFLGWRTDVNYIYSNRFNEYFFPMLDGNIAVRQAAVDAAACVPGEGTTPIRFYGDTTYDGTSWS